MEHVEKIARSDRIANMSTGGRKQGRATACGDCRASRVSWATMREGPQPISGLWDFDVVPYFDS